MRIDAHQHYWKIARGDYFWMGPAVAPLCRDFLPSELAPHLNRHRIDATVVVQAAPTIAETEFLLELAEQNPSIAGVVGWLDLESPAFEATLARLSAHEKLLGVRPMLQDLDDDSWITRPRVIEALRALSKVGLSLDFLVYERHLPHVCRALELVPELRSVVDHAAKPDLRGGDLGSWKHRLAAVAAHPSVFCKLSGLVTEADPKRCSAVDLAPAIEAVFELFGENRVIFGSDWPVCTLAATYDEVIGRLEEVLGSRLSASAYAKLFGENAKRLYRIA